MTSLTLHTPDLGETCIIARPGIAFYQFPMKRAADLAADLRSFVHLSPDADAAKLGGAWLIVKTSEMLALADQLDDFAAAYAGRRAQLHAAGGAL